MGSVKSRRQIDHAFDEGDEDGILGGRPHVNEGLVNAVNHGLGFVKQHPFQVF